MKPAGDNNASAFLLAVGHGLSFVFLCFALHVASEGFRTAFSIGMSVENLPLIAQHLLAADAVLQTWWLPLVPVVAFVSWLDWRLLVRLLRSPNSLFSKLWGYCAFALMFLITVLCVGSFCHWMWEMDQPIGGLS